MATWAISRLRGGRREPAPAPPPNVTAEPIGEGVWFLAGQSHHSVLVEFSDHLMLIEAPQSEARTLAVIAKARELKPDKPLTQLVTTHHHFDHTGGMRAAIAEGLSVITHARQRLCRDDGEAPAHIQPDVLSKSPSRHRPDRGKRTRGDQGRDDGRHALPRRRQSALRHDADGLLSERTGDRGSRCVQPGRGPYIYAANLLENITKRAARRSHRAATRRDRRSSPSCRRPCRSRRPGLNPPLR